MASCPFLLNFPKNYREVILVFIIWAYETRAPLPGALVSSVKIIISLCHRMFPVKDFLLFFYGQRLKDADRPLDILDLLFQLVQPPEFVVHTRLTLNK